MGLVTSLFCTLLITVLLILALRPIAMAVGLVDTPGGRKTHEKSTPIVGGIAMYLGLLFGGISLGILPSISWLLLGSSLLIVIGVIDDRFNLSPAVRLIAQTSVALMMIFLANLQITSLGSPLFFDWALGVFSVPFTILITLTMINAFNVLDGIDGLSGGVTFIVLGFMAFLSIDSTTLNLTLLLMTTIFGFLLCNTPSNINRKAKCFMGDAGSTFLGFSIIWLGISLSQGESPSMSPVTGLWLVAIPIFDFTVSVLRRILSGKSPFAPDRNHLHYILLDAGRSPKKTLFLILMMTLITSTIGLIGQIFSVPDSTMFLLWLALGAVYYRSTYRVLGHS
jgi:UDP-GlcNAc:undecaprenyl-phosphate GlcNAc-1-phosphate transferase